MKSLCPRPFYLALSYGLRMQLPGALQHVKLVRLVQQFVQRSVAALWEQKAEAKTFIIGRPAGLDDLSITDNLIISSSPREANSLWRGLSSRQFKWIVANW